MLVAYFLLVHDVDASSRVSCFKDLRVCCSSARLASNLLRHCYHVKICEKFQQFTARHSLVIKFRILCENLCQKPRRSGKKGVEWFHAKMRLIFICLLWMLGEAGWVELLWQCFGVSIAQWQSSSTSNTQKLNFVLRSTPFADASVIS